MRFARGIEYYLNEVTDRLNAALGDNLVGAYVFGSLAYDDFAAGQSDIDVMAICSTGADRDTKQALARELAHENLPCPAVGLDFILTTYDCASTAPTSPTFEFSISTGENWETEVEFGGVYRELVLEFAICRKHAIVLAGPTPAELFAEIPGRRVEDVLRNVVEWHRKYLFHSFHDPLGHYAVLNACRAWRFAEERVLCSKTAGADWILARGHSLEIVKEARAIRTGERPRHKLDRTAVESFLDLAATALA
jgi:hypothetical protein